MGSRFKFEDSGSNFDSSTFITKPQGDILYHNENDDVDMRNHKIVNLKDGTENSDAVNKNQLDDKVDTRIFATLSTDVRWLLDNHLLPSTYNTQIQQLLTKINNLETTISTTKTIKTVSNIGTLPVTTQNDHFLLEVDSDTTVLATNFFFETSDRTGWHDLHQQSIKDILGLSYIKQKILEDKRQFILHSTNNEWWRKTVFTNLYSLRYKFEYITTDTVTLNDNNISVD